MCGIVAAAAERDVVPILVSGLKALEYRGYDSAGLSVLSGSKLSRARTVGKVRELEARLEAGPMAGMTGIAHTRWATHGAPNEANAHPHLSTESVSVVHNGIIENHGALRAELKALGYRFESDTDTEVIVHLVHHSCAQGLGLRAAALFVTLYNTGARITEVLTLKVHDLMDAPSPRIHLLGKGRKQRIIPLWPTTARRLRA
jgi:glucosamine--fructose-6-phosphate aminotransferase (isomerizing)